MSSNLSLTPIFYFEHINHRIVYFRVWQVEPVQTECVWRRSSPGGPWSFPSPECHQDLSDQQCDLPLEWGWWHHLARDLWHREARVYSTLVQTSRRVWWENTLEQNSGLFHNAALRLMIEGTACCTTHFRFTRKRRCFIYIYLKQTLLSQIYPFFALLRV